MPNRGRPARFPEIREPEPPLPSASLWRMTPLTAIKLRSDIAGRTFAGFQRASDESLAVGEIDPHDVARQRFEQNVVVSHVGMRFFRLPP